MMAAARYGLEHQLELEPALAGNAYDDAQAARVPTTLREALALWQSSTVAREAFGDEVVAHYANAARIELEAYDAAVTDWELFRGFERL
jgi:glutamine synthetase